MDAVNAVRQGKAKVSVFDAELPTVHNTVLTTAILEAGRRSLDAKGASIDLIYNDAGECVDLKPTTFPAAAAHASAGTAVGSAASS